MKTIYQDILYLMQEGNHQKAIDFISVQLQHNPSDTTLLKLRAQCFAKLNQLPYAINDYNDILKINPNDSEIIGAKMLAEHIVSTSSLDVYASTNTHLDPWD